MVRILQTQATSDSLCFHRLLYIASAALRTVVLLCPVLIASASSMSSKWAESLKFINFGLPTTGALVAPEINARFLRLLLVAEIHRCSDGLVLKP